MARLSWPPSPSVEDEETSLAREHGSDTSDSDTDHGKPPGVSRGLVDQIPMIIDLNAKEEPMWDKEKVLKKRSETCHNGNLWSRTTKAPASSASQWRETFRLYAAAIFKQLERTNQ